jgi:hypothetical protein
MGVGLGNPEMRTLINLPESRRVTAEAETQ